MCNNGVKKQPGIWDISMTYGFVCGLVNASLPITTFPKTSHLLTIIVNLYVLRHVVYLKTTEEI